MKQLKDNQMDILFYGAFGHNIPLARVGGAEIGCRRSLDLLRKHGFSVHVVEKPTTYYGVKRFLLDYMKAVIHILRVLVPHRGRLFYLTGFYDRQLPFEALLLVIARGCGCRIIYEPKNGMLVKKYENGSRIYRKLSDYVFKHSDRILCQGLEYVEFFQNRGCQDAVYHPNYVSNYTLSLVQREEEPVEKGTGRKILYFGRVTPSKNIDVCLEIFQKFHEEREDSELYIIGGAEEDYMEALKRQAASMKIGEALHFTGPLAFREIAGYLNRSHYFLFPSGEEFEGHSNSLTEAMAFGVVPVASGAGFSRSVIGDDSLIADSKKASDYLRVIQTIEDQDQWSRYSEYVSGRVRECYSEDVVKEQYLEMVETLVKP